jgi:hypothetical protein
MLKTGRGLYAGASLIEIDAGEVEVVFVQSGFEARNFGTEPSGDIAVGVNGDANLALLDDSMNLDGTEGVGAEADMHLGVHPAIHLQLGGGAGRDGRGRRSRGRGRRGVEHLVSLGKLGCGHESGGERGRGGWRRGCCERSRNARR